MDHPVYEEVLQEAAAASKHGGWKLDLSGTFQDAMGEDGAAAVAAALGGLCGGLEILYLHGGGARGRGVHRPEDAESWPQRDRGGRGGGGGGGAGWRGVRRPEVAVS